MELQQAHLCQTPGFLTPNTHTPSALFLSFFFFSFLFLIATFSDLSHTKLYILSDKGKA